MSMEDAPQASDMKKRRRRRLRQVPSSEDEKGDDGARAPLPGSPPSSAKSPAMPMSPPPHVNEGDPGIAAGGSDSFTHTDEPRGVFPNPTGTTCYLASLLQSLLPCRAVLQVLSSRRGSDARGAGCAWCLFVRSEEGTRSQNEWLDLRDWSAFFEGAHADWDFVRRQHDCVEALQLILEDGEHRVDEAGASLTQRLRAVFGQTLREMTWTTYSCDHVPPDASDVEHIEYVLELKPPEQDEAMTIVELLECRNNAEPIDARRPCCPACGIAPQTEKNCGTISASKLLLISINRQIVTQRVSTEEQASGRGGFRTCKCWTPL